MEKKKMILILVLAVLVVLVLALAGCGDKKVPVVMPTQAIVAPVPAVVDLGPLQDAISALEAKVDKIEAPAPVDLSSIENAISALEAKIEARGPVVAEIVEAKEPEPVVEVKTAEVAEISDFERFGDIPGIVDVTREARGYTVQNTPVVYFCSDNEVGVFFSMDPGTVMGESTKDLAIVGFVSCPADGLITFTTPHWAWSNPEHTEGHQQITLAGLNEDFKHDILEALQLLQRNEQRIGYFFGADGTLTVYPVPVQ